MRWNTELGGKLNMNKRKIVTIVSIFFLITLQITTIHSVEQEGKGIIYVDDDADPGWYDATHVHTIQEGVDNATAGDTIYVYMGTYDENIDIDKSLNIQSDTSPIINGMGVYGFRISSDSVMIENMTIVNATEGIHIYHPSQTMQNTIIRYNRLESCDTAIKLDNVMYCTIFSNTLNNTSGGIRLQDGSENTIESNQIQNVTSYGIYLYESSNNNILSNEIRDGIKGIELKTQSNTNQIIGNNISYTQDGIYVYYNLFYNNITHNNIFNNTRAIYSYLSGLTRITSNTIHNNTGQGIHFDHCTYGYITGNTIFNNGYEGIQTDESSHINISFNNIHNNSESGISMVQTNDNTIYNNQIHYNNKVNNFFYGGIYSEASDYAHIDHNHIHHNTRHGIHIRDHSYHNNITSNHLDHNSNYAIIILLFSEHNLIADNNISSNFGGIKFGNSNDYTQINTVTTNDIINQSDYGIYITCPDSIIYDNYFNNSNNAYITENNIWNITKTLGTNIIDGPYLGGNFWSDYTGIDTNGDGLGDTLVPHGPGDMLPLLPLIIDAGINDSNIHNDDVRFIDHDSLNVSVTNYGDTRVNVTVTFLLEIENMSMPTGWEEVDSGTKGPYDIDPEAWVESFFDVYYEMEGEYRATFDLDITYQGEPVPEDNDPGNDMHQAVFNVIKIPVTLEDADHEDWNWTKVYEDIILMHINFTQYDGNPLQNQSQQPKTLYLEYFKDSTWKNITNSTLDDPNDQNTTLTFNFTTGENGTFDELPGNYTIRFRFEGDDRYQPATETGNITILNNPPNANFTYEPINPTTQSSIQFTDLSTDIEGDIAGWYWDFGDGNTSSEQHPTHHYELPTLYQVCLTVEDTNSDIDMYCRDILVTGIDINQSIYNRGFPIRHTWDGDWGAAQNFTATLNTLTSCEIYLRKFGTPEFNLTIELRTDHPEGTLLDTLSFTPEELLSSWQWLELDFDDITVEPESNFFIVLPPAPSNISTSFGYEWGYAFGDQYQPGSFWFTRDGGNLWRDLPTRYEFVFKTYGYD